MVKATTPQTPGSLVKTRVLKTKGTHLIAEVLS